jgi:hypothetical protein
MPEREPLTEKRQLITAYVTLNRRDGQTIVRTVKPPKEETELPPEKAEASGRLYQTEHKEIVLELDFKPVDPSKVQKLFEEGRISKPFFKNGLEESDQVTILNLYEQGKGGLNLCVYLPPNKRNLTALLNLVSDAIEQSELLPKKYRFTPRF